MMSEFSRFRSDAHTWAYGDYGWMDVQTDRICVANRGEFAGSCSPRGQAAQNPHAYELGWRGLAWVYGGGHHRRRGLFRVIDPLLS